MATIRLFDEDAYLKTGTAKVIFCEQVTRNDETLFACILDKTIFFPEEGGQSPDKGTINGIDVIDVQVKDRVITHYLKESIAVGAEVELLLDFNHRFSNMQHHSGEHIFSGLVNKLYGFENVGFHLSDNSVTMDFNGVLTEDDLRKIERKVNEVITENVEIIAGYVDDETLKTLNYRSKKELDGPIRIVNITGYDICACCAPHVKRTGEIGMLKIVHCMNYKGGVRINILCGFRALEYYRESLALIDTLTNSLTTGRENLIKHITKLKDDNYSLTGDLFKAKQELLNKELENIPAEQENVFIFKDNTDSAIMKNAVNALTEQRNGVVAFFSLNSEGEYTYMLASKERDVREIQKLLAERYGAKGGGKPNMINGKVKASETDIREMLANF